jgi:hypothetical protein
MKGFFSSSYVEPYDEDADQESIEDLVTSLCKDELQGEQGTKERRFYEDNKEEKKI